MINSLSKINTIATTASFAYSHLNIWTFSALALLTCAVALIVAFPQLFRLSLLLFCASAASATMGFYRYSQEKKEARIAQEEALRKKIEEERRAEEAKLTPLKVATAAQKNVVAAGEVVKKMSREAQYFLSVAISAALLGLMYQCWCAGGVSAGFSSLSATVAAGAVGLLAAGPAGGVVGALGGSVVSALWYRVPWRWVIAAILAVAAIGIFWWALANPVATGVVAEVTRKMVGEAKINFFGTQIMHKTAISVAKKVSAGLCLAAFSLISYPPLERLYSFLKGKPPLTH